MSGTVLGLALVAATVTIAGTTAAASVALVSSAAASGTADAAALAGADAASGRSPGAPCSAAARLAEANDASLVACAIDGTTVTVIVELRSARAAATAGPAP